MIISGLKNKGFHDLAFNLAMRHHQQVGEVFKKTGTLWEYYAPETTDPGFLARPDFVGWTGLVPVAVLFEAIFGLKASHTDKTITWDIRLAEEHGIERYPIGKEGLLNLKCLNRNSENTRPVLEITSNTTLTLNYSWKGGKESLNIIPGINKN
jgi:hypothetical protein